MKLMYFDDFQIGVLKDGRIVNITSVLSEIPHRDRQDLMAGLIEKFDVYKPRIEKFVTTDAGISLASVKVRAPLPRPRKIDCMAVNYMENGTLSTPAPINAFHKSPSALIGPEETMVLPDVPATVFEGEAELAIVIGKRASNVTSADALSHIFGYVNFIDGSARGLPPHENRFFQMKSRDTFAPIGPYLVTADEIPDPQKLRIRLWVNQTLKQDFNAGDMTNNISRCVQWISSIHTLEPGDILTTGTNHRGLSAFQDGDVVELETEGLGRLRIYVRDDLKRTWTRDTRFDATEKFIVASGRSVPSSSVSARQLTGKYAAKAV